MPIKKEWKCLAHSITFEAVEGKCPHGCSVVAERTFLTAPGAISKKTSNTDRLLNQLARDYGLSDMSNKDGKAVSGVGKKPDFSPVWGDVPKGNKLVIGKGEEAVKGAIGGATAAATGYRVTDAPPVIKEAGMIEQVGRLRAPKPIVDKRLTYGSPAELVAAAKKAA